MSEIDQLLEQYKPLVLKKARTLYLAGGDRAVQGYPGLR